MYCEEAPPCTPIPIGVLFISKGGLGQRLLYLHPYEKVEPPVEPPHPSKTAGGGGGGYSKTIIPTLKQRHTQLAGSGERSFPTQFGITTCMLADILSAKPEVCNQPFELKIDNVRFVGYPKKLRQSALTKSSREGCVAFHIVFVLPSNIGSHEVAALQMLSKKLALAIDDLQNMNHYLDKEERIMRNELDEWDAKMENERDEHPWNKVREKSSLANLLKKVYDDVQRSGNVQVFVDDFVEVGFCVESRALMHAHLQPKNREDIEKLVKMIRPYHGILLLEDVWPSPDSNPSVTLLLKHCEADRSILDMSVASGIPLLQVFLIVRHLLLWARAILIYPLCDTNVYTSATKPKDLTKHISRFNAQFGENLHLAEALAAFDPPAQLSSFVHSGLCLAERKHRATVVVALLRNQLLMQLHRFIYILPPYSDAELPRPGRHCPDSLKNDIMATSDLSESVQQLVCDICGKMLETESFSTVDRRLSLFLRMSPFMNGQHHVEDIVYRLEETREKIGEVIDSFSLVLSTFLRPDHIAESL